MPTSATKTENPQALAYPYIYVDIDRNRSGLISISSGIPCPLWYNTLGSKGQAPW